MRKKIAAGALVSGLALTAVLMTPAQAEASPKSCHGTSCQIGGLYLADNEDSLTSVDIVADGPRVSVLIHWTVTYDSTGRQVCGDYVSLNVNGHYAGSHLCTIPGRTFGTYTIRASTDVTLDWRLGFH